jgi:hypothetical protein
MDEPLKVSAELHSAVPRLKGNAFDQLSEACTITRQKNCPKVPDTLNDVLQTMHALDTLDAATSLNPESLRHHLHLYIRCKDTS